MASIANDPGGRRRILFVDKNGDRKTIWLGKMSKRLAEEVKTKVESINTAAIAGCSIDGETAEWLGRIGKDLHGKLASVRLVTPREPLPTIEKARLGQFIERYVAGRTDAKERTILNLRMFGNRLMAFFGADKRLDDVKRSDADAWIISLKGQYAAATVGRTIKGARQLFQAACRAEIIARNPFDGIKAGSHTDKERQYFVSLETAQRVLDACPDAEWRLLFALSRFGGLRCPSEHFVLTWPDVDWGRERFRVDSPKTGVRWVPIFPELRPYLEEAFELAPEGAVYVVNRHRDSNVNLRTQLQRIIRRAALKPWPKLFQNLRATRETELAKVHPLHVVCSWIGNSTLDCAEALPASHRCGLRPGHQNRQCAKQRTNSAEYSAAPCRTGRAPKRTTP